MSQTSQKDSTATRLQKATQSPVSVPVGSPVSQIQDAPSHEQSGEAGIPAVGATGRPEGSPDEDWFRAETQILRSTGE